MAEARGELKCVVAGPAVHRVIASTTDDDVITTAGINDVITALAIDHVTVAIEGDAVITLTAMTFSMPPRLLLPIPLLGSGGAQTLRVARITATCGNSLPPSFGQVCSAQFVCEGSERFRSADLEPILKTGNAPFAIKLTQIVHHPARLTRPARKSVACRGDGNHCQDARQIT
jgi:hypothetical protein